GRTARQQGVSSRFERLPPCDVRELLATQHVASRVDVWDVRAQAVVNGDALSRVGDACTIEPQTLHVRPTSSRHQDDSGHGLAAGIRRDDDAMWLLPHANRATTEPAHA